MTPMEQRTEALKRANHIRSKNARTIRQIGELSSVEGIDEVVGLLRNAEPGEPICGLPIYRLLTAPRFMGDKKTRQLLRQAEVVSGDRKLRELTQRQRDVIARHLECPELLWPDSLRARRRSAA